MGGKCRPGAWLVQGSPRPCAPLNVQCPSSPATSTPHPSCIAVCDGSVIDPRQTINCNANANAMGLQECGVTRHEEVENALHGISQHRSVAVHHRGGKPSTVQNSWQLVLPEGSSPPCDGAGGAHECMALASRL